MKHLFLATLVTGLFISCNNTEEADTPNNENGDVQLYFDTTANGDKLLLDTSFYNSEEGEQLKISRFNFIVSNIRLVGENGDVFVYPKEKSYFIINSEEKNLTVELENIPAGNYKQLILGLGVDQEKYLSGEENQQEFWDYAESQHMTWTWITGYKFINFQGEFKSNNITTPKEFTVHIGSHGSSLDNYREITLELPNTARVGNHKKSSIHLMVDAMKLVNGSNKVKLEDHLNPAETSAVIMVNAEWSPKIMSNATEMFTVDHVHNNGENH